MQPACLPGTDALTPASRALRLALLAAVVPAGSDAHAAAGAPPEQAYSVQLHTHASLSENNGSIEWHAAKAQDAGVDVIWWTDHDWRVNQTGYTEAYDFENCTWDGQKFVEPDNLFEERWWEVAAITPDHAKSVVDSLAWQGAKSLRMEVAYAGGTFQRLNLSQTGSRHQNRYSLATRYRLRFALFPQQLDPADNKFVFELLLSERPGEWPRLRYVIGSMDGEDVGAVPLAWTPGQWNVYDLDVLADVQNLLSAFGADSIRAQDNNTYGTHAILESRNGARAVVFLDDIRYENDDSLAGEPLLDWQDAADAYYRLQYPGVEYLVGSEISRYKAQPHLNGYAPDHVLVDYTGTVFSDSLYYAVDQVHAQGGLVSYNHPWGIGIYGNPSETPAQKAARILTMKRGLLRCRALRCDLLEVGYRWRQGIPLSGHLDLWDCLNANALFLTGIGVTDSHGSTPFYGWAPWQPVATYENNYVTWLWATGTTASELLRPLASGNAYFGDPYRWQGDLEVGTADGFPMGRVILTDKAAEDVIIRVTNVPATVSVRLLQGEIREDPPSEYTTVNWLRDETLVGTVADGVFQDTVSVDVTLPAFVRIEVQDGSREWVFSNPVHFVRAVPSDGVPAARVAASLDALRIRTAENLVLRAASFDPGDAELALMVDETTPGLGRVVVDCAAFGPPTGVSGATSWVFDTGLLTLDGFAGTGSAITVGWGPGVSAPTPTGDRPRDLALSPGRPNPFGRGVVAEFALPDPGQALLEVLDVRGRRVRVLRDEWTEAGRHRAAWDGNDTFGRPVADGVYFIRLRALGTTLTTKSVKIR